MGFFDVDEYVYGQVSWGVYYRVPCVNNSQSLVSNSMCRLCLLFCENLKTMEVLLYEAHCLDQVDILIDQMGKGHTVGRRRRRRRRRRDFQERVSRHHSLVTENYVFRAPLTHPTFEADEDDVLVSEGSGGVSYSLIVAWLIVPPTPFPHPHKKVSR